MFDVLFGAHFSIGPDLRAWIRQKFGYPFDVTITCVDQIARSTAGKFQDFICKVA